MVAAVEEKEERVEAPVLRREKAVEGRPDLESGEGRGLSSFAADSFAAFFACFSSYSFLTLSTSDWGTAGGAGEEEGDEAAEEVDGAGLANCGRGRLARE